MGIPIEIDTGLLFKMFKKPNKEQLASFVHVAKKSKWLTAERTKFLVRQILRVIKNQRDLEPLYSDLLWFLEDVKIIDEDLFGLVDEVTDNEIANSGTVYYYIRHIFKVADTNLFLAARIIEKITRIENMSVPGQEDLLNFVTKLYESGNKELADEICVLVSNHGSLILKAIYNIYN